MKEKVRRAARRAALSVLEAVSSAPKGSFVRALYFHEVSQEHAGNFAALLQLLAQEGKFIDTPTCLAMLRGLKPVDGRYFHLSFDDGRQNLLEYAAPLLKRRKIPAVFFVCTAWVGRDPQSLGWEDLRRLRDWGFEVGSHTRTHANLVEASRDGRLQEEVASSKRELEAALATPCRYFAWPFGRRRDINPTALEAVMQAGYEASFGAFRGSMVPGKTNPFRIPRHHLEADWPWNHVRYFALGHGE